MTAEIIVGDCREILQTLPPESVDCCVTSPPYFNLRNYGIDGQMGLEKTIPAYVESLVSVFREVRRVLRNDGTLWLNIGDSYAANGGAHRLGSYDGETGRAMSTGSIRKSPLGLKSKDLMMIPAKVAIALQEDGWWLRSDIIWNKPNPMPESVTDRPTCAHEHIFLLSKSAKYFYDADAVRTPLAISSITRLSQDIDGQDGSNRANGGDKTNGAMKAVARLDKQRGHSRRHAGFNDRWDGMSREEQQANGANLRNVWTISPKGYKGAHFAVFPIELPSRCIKAGCPEGGTVLDPFGGSGTTAQAAEELNRHSILIELNPEYAALAENRVSRPVEQAA